jgi:nucleotide-binding universal stress UspA family protein
MGSGDLVQETLARQEEEILNDLDLLATDVSKGISVRRAVYEGDPGETIASHCAAERVGLVMMPRTGCDALRRFVFGSVTAMVLHHVGCPVWTSAHLPDRRRPSFRIPEVIVCATDLMTESEPILRWAIELAAKLNAQLIVAHAIPSLKFQPETYDLDSEMRRALIGNAHAKIWGMLHGSPLVGGEAVVKGGRVSTVVRNVLADSRADLLVIGRPSRTDALGRLRTHSYDLIRESSCPVITI